MGLVDPTTFIYKFISDPDKMNDTNIIQYVIMRGLRLCIKIKQLCRIICSIRGHSVTIHQYQLVLIRNNITFV